MPDQVNVIHIGRQGRTILVQIMPQEVHDRRIEIEDPGGLGTSAMYPEDERIASIGIKIEDFGPWLSHVNEWWRRMQAEKLERGKIEAIQLPRELPKRFFSMSNAHGSQRKLPRSV